MEKTHTHIHTYFAFERRRRCEGFLCPHQPCVFQLRSSNSVDWSSSLTPWRVQVSFALAPQYGCILPTSHFSLSLLSFPPCFCFFFLCLRVFCFFFFFFSFDLVGGLFTNWLASFLVSFRSCSAVVVVSAFFLFLFLFLFLPLLFVSNDRRTAVERRLDVSNPTFGSWLNPSLLWHVP